MAVKNGVPQFYDDNFRDQLLGKGLYSKDDKERDKKRLEISILQAKWGSRRALFSVYHDGVKKGFISFEQYLVIRQEYLESTRVFAFDEEGDL